MNYFRLYKKLIFLFLFTTTSAKTTPISVEIINNTNQTINFIDAQAQIHTLRPHSYCYASIETSDYFTWSVISVTDTTNRRSALDPESATIQFESLHGAHVSCISKPDFIDQCIRKIVTYTQHFTDGLTLGLLTNSTEIMDANNRKECAICYGVGMFTTLYAITQFIQRARYAI